MLFDHDLTGESLSPRTLCLTFDDGPGPDSAGVGDFLAGHGIAATFFVVGTHARERPEAITRLRASGHLVGNHTDTHPTLVSFLRDGGDVAVEVARTAEAIGDLGGPDAPSFFRPPYGDWRDDAPGADPATSPVARFLNESGRFPDLIGPVGWDIDARDWWFWREGRSVEECGAAYLAAITARDRGGIILLHDWAETPALRAGNRVLALVRWLIPRLIASGYRFVRLDAVPGMVRS